MGRVEELEATLRAREATIAHLSLQLRELQLELASLKASPSGPSSSSSSSAKKPRPRAAPLAASMTQRRPSSASSFFRASQRGGTLTQPRQWKGLTEQERTNPYEAIRGPSLLTRERFGARKPTADLLATTSGNGRSPVNLLLDDSPTNNPVKYHPFRGWAFPPSDYVGPEDARETDDLSHVHGGNCLHLAFAFGYCGRRSRSNLFYNADGRIVYHVAALGVVYDQGRHEQMFFFGHDDDITALDMHPDKVKVVTGQIGRIPKIIVWSSRPDSAGELHRLCQIEGDHRRAIIGLSFSSMGTHIASMGKDNNRSIAIYRWGKDKGLERATAERDLDHMRVGIDKGHNDEVYALDYNPLTDEVVAVGKKYIRFFGVKEGVEAKRSAERDALISDTESALWSKKGVFGKFPQEDLMCVAFDEEGLTYAGSASGHIFRFRDYMVDAAVKAHCGEGKDSGKVTALWYSPHTQELISSGDDGMIKAWKPSEWGGRAAPEPLRSVDLEMWVNASTNTPVLAGTPVVPDPKFDTKGEPRLGSCAAAHSIYGDARGNVLVGTVCNEIYELSFEGSEPPMCYMQGHHEELWGLAEHPTRQEFATAGEDATLRVWDLESRTMKQMAALTGPGRAVAYSPDGRLIAVGIGAGGKAKRAASRAEGSWMLFEAESLAPVPTQPAQLLKERIADIKWSPDGNYVAVASADNFIDVYQASQASNYVEYKGRLKGHSSFVRRLDWSTDSCFLQSCCGAYELLYWKLHNAEGAWRPRQEKSSSKMRDVQWATQTTLFGWSVRGIWPHESDGTDINAIARSHGATSHEGLLATADDFGKVKLFRYPCIVPHAAHLTYEGHSSHVTNVAFTHGDAWLLSIGGDDRAILQWAILDSS